MPITEESFLKEIAENKSSSKELMKEIKNNDIDSNGYLTNDELNVVFAQVYPKLKGRSMFKIFKPFGSIQNKSLIDYKKLLSYIKARINQLSITEEKPETTPLENGKNEENDIGYEEKGNSFELDPLKHNNNRLLSPNTKRMENMKSNFLKSINGNPLQEENQNVEPQVLRESSPVGEIRNKTKLDALISPRMKRTHFPKLTSQNLNKKFRKLPLATALSPKRHVTSKTSEFSSFSNPLESKINEGIRVKLSYEWRNIYRSLNTIDLNSSGLVTRKEFES